MQYAIPILVKVDGVGKATEIEVRRYRNPLSVAMKFEFGAMRYLNAVLQCLSGDSIAHNLVSARGYILPCA